MVVQRPAPGRLQTQRKELLLCWFGQGGKGGLGRQRGQSGQGGQCGMGGQGGLDKIKCDPFYCEGLTRGHIFWCRTFWGGELAVGRVVWVLGMVGVEVSRCV